MNKMRYKLKFFIRIFMLMLTVLMIIMMIFDSELLSLFNLITLIGLIFGTVHGFTYVMIVHEEGISIKSKFLFFLNENILWKNIIEAKKLKRSKYLIYKSTKKNKIVTINITGMDNNLLDHINKKFVQQGRV